MSDDLNAEIKIGADASGVEAGVGKAKRSLADLGQAAKRTGQEGGAGLAPIGDGATAASKKVEAATKNTIQSIQRQIAMFEAGSKSAREYQESLARQRGVDVGAIKPYLDQLDAAKRKQKEAADSSALLSTGLATVKFAAVAAVGALAAWAVSLNTGVDALNDLSDATGSTIENISALEDVARRSGTGLDTVSTSLIKLNQALATAKPGSDAEKAINAIGLSVKELKTLDPSEAFRQIAVALSGYDDDANKARLTQELFGKSLKDVAPLLKDLAAQSKLAATVTTEQAQAAETLNKEMFALQKNVTDIGRSMISDLVPAINQTIKAFREGQAAGKGFVEVAWDRYWANVSGFYAGPAKSMDDYKARLKDIDKVLSSGHVYYVDRNKLLKEQIELKKELAALEQFSPDNESAAETKRLSRRQSVGDIGTGGPDKAAIAAANRELAEQAKLIGELNAAANGFSPNFEKEMEALGNAYKRGAISLAELVDLDAKLLAKQPIAVAAAKDREDSQKALAKAQEDSRKQTEKYYDSISKELSALDAGNTKLREQIEEIGLTIPALNALRLARLDAAIAQEEEILTMASAHEATVEELKLMQKRIDLLKEQRSLTATGQNKQIAADEAKAAVSEWQKAADKINDSITDALMRGFESGKGFVENLRDTVVNIFKTMVLRPVISAVVTGFTGTGASAGQGGGGGIGGNLSTIKSLWDAGSSLFNGEGFSSLVTSGVANLSKMVGEAGFDGLSKTIGQYAGTIGDYAEVLGEGLGYLNAATAAAEGKWGKAIGSAVGTYFFGPIGGAVGDAIGSFVDGLFDGGGYVNSTGDAIRNYSADGQTKTNSTNGASWFNNTDGANKLVDGLQAQYMASAKALGIGTVASVFNYGSNNSDGGKFAIGGGAGSKYAYSGETKTSDEAVKLAASRAIFAALQGSDLPQYIAKVFDGITAGSASQEDIDSALNYAGSLKQIRDALLETRTPLQILQDAVSSSFASLGTSAETFKTDFVAAIDAGITPDKLVLWQQLGVNLDELAAAGGKAADGVEKATRSLTDIANERKNLQDQLDELTLTDTELLAKQRDALDESNRALFDQVQAAQAAKDATQELADAQEVMLARIKDSLSGLGDTRFSLENELLGLQGKGTELDSRNRTRDLAKLTEGVTSQADIDRITAAYDYNRSLEQQIEALKQSAAAAEESARAQEQAAESASRAAEQLKQAWQGITDSILDEVSRIRGEISGKTSQGLAEAQAKFAIAAAQASAGDQTAAKSLPELSRSMLELAAKRASTLEELQTIQGTTANTLESLTRGFSQSFGVSLPEASANYIPAPVQAPASSSQAYIPAPYVPPEQQSTPVASDGVTLEERMQRIEAALNSIAGHTNKSARLLDGAVNAADSSAAIKTKVLV